MYLGRAGGWKPSPAQIVEELKQNKLDGIYLMDCPGVDKTFIAKLHAAKKKVYVWNANDKVAVFRLRTIGVDGIVSKRPKWLRSVLDLPEDALDPPLDPPIMKTAIEGLHLGALKKTVVAKFKASEFKHGELDTHGLFYEAHYLEGSLTGDKSVQEIRVRYAQGRLKVIEVNFQPNISLKALEKLLSKRKDLTFVKRDEKVYGDPKQRMQIYIRYKNATFDQPVDCYISCTLLYRYDHDRLVGSTLSKPLLVYDYTPLKTH